MRALFVAFVLAVLSVLPIIAQERGPKDVISSQIEAFKVDDFATAFTFAHPNIKNIFRTPENFGRMVQQGYPMVWRPAEVEYLEQRELGGQVFQDVQIVDDKGRVFVLEYAMIETPEGWKISGVRILERGTISA